MSNNNNTQSQKVKKELEELARRLLKVADEIVAMPKSKESDAMSQSVFQMASVREVLEREIK